MTIIVRYLCCLAVLALVAGGCAHVEPRDQVRQFEPSASDQLTLGPEGEELDRDANGCGKFACICEGPRNCLDLIESNKCSDDFKCVGPPPLCTCTRK